MGERPRYTALEIIRMRAAVHDLMTAEASHWRNPSRSAAHAIVERELLTYMSEGVPPEELEAAADEAWRELTVSPNVRHMKDRDSSVMYDER